MSQRKRSRRIASDESAEEDVSQEAPRSQKRRKVDSDDEGDTQGTQKKVQITQQERQKLIGEMMRFMLFSESHKKPLRKDEVNKHVMKNYKNRKLYDEIFAEAKYQLSNTFGYEVVELVPEAGKKASNTQYAMINKLAGNPLLLEYVETPDAQELTLLTTILDMIYINDELLDHDLLIEQLAILGMHKGEHHPVFGDWDKLLNNWIRQGYITKKRNDTAREGQITYEYTLGPRALHVVTRKNLLKHVAVVLNEDVDPIRAKELEDKERENQKNNNAVQNENEVALEPNESQASQPVQRSNNNNNNSFRPMIGALPSGSNAGRPSAATYTKKGRAGQRTRNSAGDDDD